MRINENNETEGEKEVKSHLMVTEEGEGRARNERKC